MLFRQETLTGIAAGAIRLAFRRWRRPSVRAGGTLLTPVGQLSIRAVEPIEDADLNARDARLAGFDSLVELRAELNRQRAGQLYRIRFELTGPDPRVALRERSELSKEEFADLSARLKRLDERSAEGPWTTRVLRLIERHPERSAGELAAESGYAKEWLKLNVRKLKNLGMTESLHPGYRLSPRGAAFVRRLK